MLAVISTIVWFVLVGLLWYARPPDLVWLFASAVLGICFFGGFLWYVTRETGPSAVRSVRGASLLIPRDSGADQP